LLCHYRSRFTSLFFFFYSPLPPRDLHSFPTRRSSDLPAAQGVVRTQLALAQHLGVDRTVMTYLIDDLEAAKLIERRPDPTDRRADRKSTRLNSSHVEISYAVFCLKKKKKEDKKSQDPA